MIAWIGRLGGVRREAQHPRGVVVTLRSGTSIRDGAMSGGTHPTLDERERLAALKAEGLSLRAIAARLGRAASTVSRELRRNALPKGGYLPVHAEGCYLERRQRPARLQSDERRRRARQPRSTIAERRSIHDRPEDVQARKEAGHWEGDLLICRRTRPVLVLKERKTRFVLAARLAGKSAAETVAIMMAVFRRLDPRLRSSITFDNDTAFARHGLLASACAMTTWFCDAYASWQKGAVENANGRLRRDLPRDLDLDALSDAELQEIVLSHNLTPRKCLGFLTPLQALLNELGRDVQIRFAQPVALGPGIPPAAIVCSSSGRNGRRF